MDHAIKRKILPFILALSLIVPMFTVIPSRAADEWVSTNWENVYYSGYRISNISLTVPSDAKSLGKASTFGDALFPNYLTGSKISSCTLDASGCTSLTKINDNVLYNHRAGVTTFKLPPTIKEIGTGFCEGTNIEVICPALNITNRSSKTFTPSAEYATATINGNQWQVYVGSSASEYGQYNSLPSSYLPSARSDQTFLGFYYGSTQIYDAKGNLNTSGASALPSGDVTLTEKWSVKVTYHDESFSGGKKEETVASGEQYKVAEGPASKDKRFYRFKGWSNAPGGSVSQAPGEVINIGNDNVDLYAVWEQSTIRYTIDPDNGSSPSTDTKPYEAFSSFQLPESPSTTKDGYKFMNWYVGDTKNTLSKDSRGRSYGSDVLKYATLSDGFNATVDVTIKAFWTQGSYTVKYSIGSGSDIFKNQSYAYEKSFSPLEYSFPGYVLKGWARNANEAVPKYYIGEEYSRLSDKDGDMITLYPVKEPIHYTIHFVKYDTADKVVNGDSIPDMDITYGTETETRVPRDLLKREGYRLVGWDQNKIAPVSTSTNGIPAQVANGGSVANLKQEIAGKVITLYPVWASNAYTITYDWDQFPQGTGVYSYFFGDYVKLPIPTKDGYVFQYWKDTKTGQRVDAIGQTDVGDKSFTAVWKESGCKVYFGDKFVVSAILDDKTILLNGIDTLDNDFPKGTVINTLTMTLSQAIKYTGVKVYDSKGEVISSLGEINGQTLIVRLNNYKLEGAITVYIEGEAQKFNIEYDLDGGKINEDYPTQYTYGMALTLPTKVTKDSYTFIGWQAPNGKYIKEIPDTQIGDIRLTAKWANGEYKYTITLDGGTTKNEEFMKNYKDGVYIGSYKFNSGTIDLPDDVTKEGFDFVGWYDYTTQSYVDCIDTSLPSEYAIYAIYSANDGTGFFSPVMKAPANATKVNIHPSDPKTGYYYYTKLSDIEKMIYTTAYDMYHYQWGSGEVFTGSINILSPQPYTKSNMYHACAALIRDHPEIFWIRTFSAATGKGGDVITYVFLRRSCWSDILFMVIG